MGSSSETTLIVTGKTQNRVVQNFMDLKLIGTRLLGSNEQWSRVRGIGQFYFASGFYELLHNASTTHLRSNEQGSRHVRRL